MALLALRLRSHRLKGPGLIESIYEKCLMRELLLRKVTAVNQRVVKIEYKGFVATFWKDAGLSSESAWLASDDALVLFVTNPSY